MDNSQVSTDDTGDPPSAEAAMTPLGLKDYSVEARIAVLRMGGDVGKLNDVISRYRLVKAAAATDAVVARRRRELAAIKQTRRPIP